jgi:hypothetical protein
MKRHAPPVVWQPKLPLVDIPALATPRQQELARALMSLLMQVGRQMDNALSASHQEGPRGCETDV